MSLQCNPTPAAIAVVIAALALVTATTSFVVARDRRPQAVAERNVVRDDRRRSVAPACAAAPGPPAAYAGGASPAIRHDAAGWLMLQ